MSIVVMRAVVQELEKEILLRCKATPDHLGSKKIFISTLPMRFLMDKKYSG
jgi:hypothetical protein